MEPFWSSGAFSPLPVLLAAGSDDGALLASTSGHPTCSMFIPNVQKIGWLLEQSNLLLNVQFCQNFGSSSLSSTSLIWSPSTVKAWLLFWMLSLRWKASSLIHNSLNHIFLGHDLFDFLSLFIILILFWYLLKRLLSHQKGCSSLTKGLLLPEITSEHGKGVTQHLKVGYLGYLWL